MLFIVAASKPTDKRIKVKRKTHHLGRSLFVLPYCKPAIQSEERALFFLPSFYFAKSLKGAFTSFKLSNSQDCKQANYMWARKEQHFNILSENCVASKCPNAFNIYNLLTLLAHYVSSTLKLASTTACSHYFWTSTGSLRLSIFCA